MTLRAPRGPNIGEAGLMPMEEYVGEELREVGDGENRGTPTASPKTMASGSLEPAKDGYRKSLWRVDHVLHDVRTESDRDVHIDLIGCFPLLYFEILNA